MKQTARIISTYTGDTSGVCSALYELGGMVVMHDPSGCNSTYSTHDEPRWYDMDSLIFISGLTEKDAIFGNDEKIISDTVNAALQLKPRFIAIAGSPIPHITGCDFDGISLEIENRCGIPCFGFPTDGMHSYIHGASMAFAAYAERMCLKRKESTDVSINILGVTPLDFSVNGSVESMKNAFIKRGIRINSVMAMGSNFLDIENSGSASVNLVVSSCGIKCAEVLKNKFGIPYVIGTPYGNKTSDILAQSIIDARKSGENKFEISTSKKAKTVIIGESVTSVSLASALKHESDIDAKVISAVDTPSFLKSDSCINALYEDEIKESIEDAEYVIADPMYLPICNKNSKFIRLPHEAFSGRIYRSEIPNLIDDIDYLLNQLKG